MYATVEQVQTRLQSDSDIDYLDDKQFEQKLYEILRRPQGTKPK